jgi:hypothetical protein
MTYLQNIDAKGLMERAVAKGRETRGAARKIFHLLELSRCYSDVKELVRTEIGFQVGRGGSREY